MVILFPVNLNLFAILLGDPTQVIDKKTVRGREISLDTVQINTIVKKEGNKKFNELFKTEETTEEKKE